MENEGLLGSRTGDRTTAFTTPPFTPGARLGVFVFGFFLLSPLRVTARTRLRSDFPATFPRLLPAFCGD